MAGGIHLLRVFDADDNVLSTTLMPEEHFRGPARLVEQFFPAAPLPTFGAAAPTPEDTIAALMRETVDPSPEEVLAALRADGHLREADDEEESEDPTGGEHLMLEPDGTDLRWRCTNALCGWTASDAFTTPTTRGASWYRHHKSSPVLAPPRKETTTDG